MQQKKKRSKLAIVKSKRTHQSNKVSDMGFPPNTIIMNYFKSSSAGHKCKQQRNRGMAVDWGSNETHLGLATNTSEHKRRQTKRSLTKYQMYANEKGLLLLNYLSIFVFYIFNLLHIVPRLLPITLNYLLFVHVLFRLNNIKYDTII